MKRLTIYDISQKAGVSIATVSRVINGSTKVSPATREKVLKIIEESGYSPNIFARGLGLNTMNTIGILCADSSDPFLAQAVYHIERNLQHEGYDVLLCCTGYELSSKQKYIKILLSKRVDAIILVGSNYVEEQDENNEYIRTAAQSVPVMLVNGELDAPNVFCTRCDDFGAICDVTSRFLAAGIKDILFLFNSFSYNARSKLNGFKEAFKLAGVPLSSTMMSYFNSRDKSVGEICSHLLELNEKGLRFDAVIATDDKLAIGALKYAKLKGLKIPEDLSVMGYDNLNIATYCDPELSSVDNKLESICNHCVSSLIGILGGNDVPKKTLFSYELIDRGSTVISLKKQK